VKSREEEKTVPLTAEAKQVVNAELTSSEENPVGEVRGKPRRSLVFKASSNSLVLSLTMLVALLIYGLMVLFVVPTTWLEQRNWQVVASLNALLYMFVVSIIFFPISLVFQLMIGGLVQDFKKCTWQMELAGLCFALIMGILFYWPGYWL